VKTVDQRVEYFHSKTKTRNVRTKMRDTNRGDVRNIGRTEKTKKRE
jgi:hypothetical protein